MDNGFASVFNLSVEYKTWERRRYIPSQVEITQEAIIRFKFQRDYVDHNLKANLKSNK